MLYSTDYDENLFAHNESSRKAYVKEMILC